MSVLYGHPLAGLLWERQFEEVLMELGWTSIELRIGNVCLVHRKQRLLISVYVDDIKVAGKKQNMAPRCKK